jgi:hypothetical protein
MLNVSVARYISLRRTMGYQLHHVEVLLRSFAAFANEREDTHIRTETALAWATAASSTRGRHTRLQAIVDFARFLHAEDPTHEIPPFRYFPASYSRRLSSQPTRAFRLAKTIKDLRPILLEGCVALQSTFQHCSYAVLGCGPAECRPKRCEGREEPVG